MTDDHSIDEGRQAILAALERHQVRYVVIGGAAAQARGWPQPTDDIDVTPERSEGNLTRLAAAVESAETILHSKATAGRPKDRAVIDSMREALGLAD